MLRDLDAKAPLTLRAAVASLEQRGGRLFVTDGRLIVELAPSQLRRFASLGDGDRLCSVLYGAERDLLAAACKRGSIEAKDVPDRPLLGSGRVAPA